ncbi:serine protease [Pelomonas sp. UHG3]|uniref:Serine protease n=1 Tax=Roseateles hydrophilus TaxID=2975054 RepID=A0ACC6C9T1_9BURK|nr:serine protease [Pelomonas sp. UHG3]MCY4745140.1 serine protease [Pelomonas sp. UHG3]
MPVAPRTPPDLSSCQPSRRHLLVMAAGLLAGSSAAVAEPLPALIARVKRSVVAVGSYGLMDTPRFGFRAAGFAVGDGLHVLTNAHVVPEETPERIDRSIAVQVWLGDDQWQLRSAKLLGRDLRNDLALLAIDGPALPALKLAEQDAPEGTSIALMGFPIGNALGQVLATHRGIVSAWTAIATPAGGPAGLNPRAVRQLRDGAFKVMQLDAVAYPGNSGGPVLDIETGEVVGVLQGGAIKGTKEAALSAPTGISYAVPASTAARLLAEYKR